jgi:membrane associated rhomboid family serine protease
VRVPATFGLVVLATATTLISWMHPLVDQLAMQTDVLHDAPWRAFTATLLHVNVLHLWFNVYWLLALGTPIERELGTMRTLLFYLVVGVASCLAEQALFHGGVGLSGIGYGAFAYGWARARTEPAWIKIVDPGTTRAFAWWFVLCIVLTVSGTLPVANVAHGVGALTGGLYGLSRTQRTMRVPLVVVVLLAFVLDAEPVRDRVNLVGEPAIEAEQRGIAALDAGDTTRAIRELEHAVALSPDDPRVLFNLGVARAHTGEAGACETFHRVLELDPNDPNAQQAIRECEGRGSYGQ